MYVALRVSSKLNIWLSYLLHKLTVLVTVITRGTHVANGIMLLCMTCVAIIWINCAMLLVILIGHQSYAPTILMYCMNPFCLLYDILWHDVFLTGV